MKARHLVAAIAAVAACSAAVVPAEAAKPKPFSKTVKVTDPTPDPSGGGIATDDICKGALPQEAPFSVKIPAVGKLKVETSGFQGDWALNIRDSKGNSLSGVDVNPEVPSNLYETALVKIKRAGTYQIQACNLGGTPEATVKYTFTPS